MFVQSHKPGRRVTVYTVWWRHRAWATHEQTHHVHLAGKQAYEMCSCCMCIASTCKCCTKLRRKLCYLAHRTAWQAGSSDANTDRVFGQPAGHTSFGCDSVFHDFHALPQRLGSVNATNAAARWPTSRRTCSSGIFSEPDLSACPNNLSGQ